MPESLHVETAGAVDDWGNHRVHLALVVDAYQRAQVRRVAAGESLRAILQGRDMRFGDHRVEDAAAALRRMRSAADPGPVPVLGREFLRAGDDEAECHAALVTQVQAHPLWPWMADERGVGHTLAARLLARVDFHRARRPSSVWRFCGLGTMKAVRWHCVVCKSDMVIAGTTKPLSHRDAHTRFRCDGALVLHEQQPGANVASPRFENARRGPTYDREAKVVCYLIGVSLLRTGASRADMYREHKQRLALLHPEWPRQRAHLTALRVMVKAFLRDAWVAARAQPG